MHGWWIAMGLFAAAACLALGPAYNHHRQRRAERARLNLLRVEARLSAPQAPDGTVLDTPTEDAPTPRGVGAVRPNRRVALSDPDLSAALSPGRRFR